MITENTIPKGFAKNSFSIYIGRYTLLDIHTGILAKGPTKVGRAKHLDALFRGRNQGGADFVMDYIFVHLENMIAWERIIHKLLTPYRITNTRRKELYNITTNKAYEVITTEYPDLFLHEMVYEDE